MIPPKDSKERKLKFVPLLPEDIELPNSIPRGFPEMPFFRHTKSSRGVPENKRFATDYFYRWRKMACENLSIKGVDLHGGTRHSTVTALSEHFSRGEIKEHGTGHDTSKAFERYMQAESKKSLKIYRVAANKNKKPEQHSDNVIRVNFNKDGK